ncbi:MAG: insulinase family protein [Streptococcaceae bacterium]|jgi:predicted Zn-dependent peptidase|nr:insulinase family protein [Streptococcaceae bacterium]
MNLRNGINLNILKTKQFKTVKIIIRFETTLTQTILAKRALISALLEKNNHDYPSNQNFQEHLESLYGAQFSVSVEKKGQLHCLSLNLTLLNADYTGQEQLLDEGINLLNSIIFKPNAANGHFDNTTFDLEKKNLIQYLENIVEDNDYYAELQLKRLFFQTPEYSLPTLSTAALIEKETTQSVFDYYQEMLENDSIEILICGDVDENTVRQAFTAFPFNSRSVQDLSCFVDEGVSQTIREQSEQKEVAQSILNIGYYIPATLADSEYFALQVFNGLFGGFSHSKLFQNIREKESLAYYISSTIDPLRHFLFVGTGIEKNNRTYVLKLIHQQLKEIQRGNFSDEEIKQTIIMLKNIYQQGLDSQKVLLERAYLSRKIPQLLSDTAWLNSLNQVTKQEIINIANQVKLQAIYFLEGGSNA